jgi:hypothetical protein
MPAALIIGHHFSISPFCKAASTSGVFHSSRLFPPAGAASFTPSMSSGDDGRFDLYVAMNMRNDWHDLE